MWAIGCTDDVDSDAGDTASDIDVITPIGGFDFDENVDETLHLMMISSSSALANHYLKQNRSLVLNLDLSGKEILIRAVAMLFWPWIPGSPAHQ